MLGTYSIEKEVVRFQPRFPLVSGVRYRAVFRPSLLPGPRADVKDIRADFELSKTKVAESTMVSHVFPSRSEVPENLLKFYVHFSAPMNRGEAYRNLRLLDDTGKAVE